MTVHGDEDLIAEQGVNEGVDELIEDSPAARESPEPEELAAEQAQRAKHEADAARGSQDEEEAAAHRRRAEKAGYLRDKLDEQAEADEQAG